MRAVSGLIVLFSVGILVGAPFGSWYKDYSERSAFNDALKKAEVARQAIRVRHFEDLRDCTILEHQVSTQRDRLDLPPVTISQVCPFLDDPNSGR